MRTDGVVVDGVSKAYGHTLALDAVSFTAGVGVTGMLGPNGAGKTTLLRILATVDGADAGTLRMLGQDPTDGHQRLQLRRSLGYLPQEPGFYRGFTAFDFVDYVAILKEMIDRRARHDEVRRVLDLVGLADVRSRRIRTLSGGMRRRLALAVALLGRPQLVILDEPTAGLDPEQRMRFRELVSGIAEDCVVVLATHMTEDVAALCREVVVLDAGRVRFAGNVPDLVGSASGRVWVTDGRAEGATLSWRTGAGEHRNIGAPPPGAILLEPTLEDAYLLLVGAAATAAVPA